MYKEGIGSYVFVDGKIQIIYPKVEIMVSSAEDLNSLTGLAPGSKAYTAGHGSEWELDLDGNWVGVGAEKPVVTLTADDDTKAYDGTALTKATVTATGLPDGYTATATASGTITNVGTAPNIVESGYKIEDGDNKDVTDQFIIKLVPGTLTVTKAAVTLTSATVTDDYDGEALTDDTITVSGDGFADGEGATYDVTGTQTDVGESDNTFTYELTEDTNPDNYTITVVTGKITVTKAALTAATGSDSKTYDGTPLTCATASLTGLVNDETATITATGSQTEVGESDNTYEITWGTAKSTNYEITDDLGTLTVTEATEGEGT